MGPKHLTPFISSIEVIMRRRIQMPSPCRHHPCIEVSKYVESILPKETYDCKMKIGQRDLSQRSLSSEESGEIVSVNLGPRMGQDMGMERSDEIRPCQSDGIPKQVGKDEDSPSLGQGAQPHQSSVTLHQSKIACSAQQSAAPPAGSASLPPKHPRSSPPLCLGPKPQIRHETPWP